MKQEAEGEGRHVTTGAPQDNRGGRIKLPLKTSHAQFPLLEPLAHRSDLNFFLFFLLRCKRRSKGGPAGFISGCG